MSRANPPSNQRSPFRAILTPNRSLSPNGFLILMGAIGFVSFAIGIAFVSMGAWPVAGFFGLDVVLVYYAFRANYRSGRAFETVEVNREAVIITQVDPKGHTEAFDFNTYWARIQLHEEPSGHTKLSIVSHGRAFSFGVFLSDDDRRSFAETLNAELHAHRTHLPA